jgi:hypothetical protein
MSDGAIYNQLSDKTKQRIDEQIAYLKQCADEHYPEQKERFTALRDGAKTVLDIIKSDKICGTGTTNWLSNLDYDQLVFAKEKCIELITKKDDEEKIKIWYTKSDLIVDFHDNGYYLTYQEAVEGLIKIVKENAEENAEKRNSLGIYPMMIRESEIHEYIPKKPQG